MFSFSAVQSPSSPPLQLLVVPSSKLLGSNFDLTVAGPLSAPSYILFFHRFHDRLQRSPTLPPLNLLDIELIHSLEEWEVHEGIAGEPQCLNTRLRRNLAVDRSYT